MQTSPPDEHRRSLESALGEQINALVSATRSLSELSAASFHSDLQPAAFHIARWLHAFGPARPSAIAEAVHMDRSSTSTLLGRMRALGLTTSTPDPEDRRSTIVDLSPEGHDRVRLTLSLRGEQFLQRLSTWEDGEVVELTELLRRLTQGPKTSVANAPPSDG